MSWRRLDGGLALGLFAISLVIYVKTLAPSVLDGDSALFQYAPHVLAVTYPTGYPTYMLLGKLWTLLVPLGSIAYRMNLFSAFLGALDIGLVYLLAQQVVGGSRLPALLSAALFATLPTFWKWAVVAKIYTLNILLVSLLLLLLLLWRASRREAWLNAAALVYGLSLGNHSTMALFAPALLLFLWLTERGLFRDVKRLLRLLLLALLPLVLYLYVPWRAAGLLSGEGELDGLSVPVAVGRGLVSVFWLDGPLRYFSARDFTGNITQGWERVPSQMGLYLRFLGNEFGLWGIVLGLVGAVRLARHKPRLLAPLFVAYVTLVLFVLRYGRGQQAAFLLPGHLIFTLCIASTLEELGVVTTLVVTTLQRVVTTSVVEILGRVLPVVVVAAFGLVPLAAFREQFSSLDQSGEQAAHRYWWSILEQHPLEDGAGLMAHWGDLTPLWYFQQAEGLRPDLMGLCPPLEETVADWLEAGRALYIAAPLQGYLSGIEDRYRLTPWGILVKISLPDEKEESELPQPQHPAQTTFGQKLVLTGYDVPEKPVLGHDLGLYVPLRLYWCTLDTLDPGYLVSLRLLDAAGNVVGHKEDRLVSAWYPGSRLPGNLPILDIFQFPLSAETSPGQYRLEMAVWEADLSAALPLEDGSSYWTVRSITVEMNQ